MPRVIAPPPVRPGLPVLVGEVLDPGDDVAEGDADGPGLGHHRVDDVGEEVLPAPRPQGVAGGRADEHADASLLVQDLLVHQLLERLGDGGRVDAVVGDRLALPLVDH